MKDKSFPVTGQIVEIKPPDLISAEILVSAPTETEDLPAGILKMGPFEFQAKFSPEPRPTLRSVKKGSRLKIYEDFGGDAETVVSCVVTSVRRVKKKQP